MSLLSGSLRPLSCISLPGSTPLKLTGSALAIVALALTSSPGIAQQPSPIPNWTPASPGTSTGQYSPNQDSNSNQAYGYARQPYDQTGTDQAQADQAPTYEQPPDYPQQQQQ